MTRLLLLLSIGLSLPLTASEARGQDRAVAVVFDDSGTMRDGDKWSYANYALQALVALLGEDDHLAVIPMSRPATVERFDLNDQAGEIATLQRAAHAVGGTPYQAVLTAMQHLRGVAATEHWLVVLSDGQFENGVPSDLDARVQEFVGETGTRAIFLLIGNTVGQTQRFARQPGVAVWQEEAQASIYQAVGAQQIIARMEQIAAEITARAAGQDLRVQRRGDSLIVNTVFPLRRLTILEQHPSRQGALATAREPDSLRVRRFDMRLPNGATDRMFGRVQHLQPHRADAVIPEGGLSLAFDRPLSGARLRVLPEVAARLDVEARYPSGRTMETRGATFAPCLGDTLLLWATLVTPTGDTLMQRPVPPDRFDVRVHRDGSNRPMTLGPRRAAFTASLPIVDEAPFTLSASAAFPGYFNFRSDVYSVEPQTCVPPRRLGLAARGPWLAPVDEIAETPPMRLVPTADGRPVPPAERRHWTLRLADDGGRDFDLQPTADGWTLRPNPGRWWWLPPAGTTEVVVALASGQPRETATQVPLSFVLEEVSFWRRWGPLLLLLLLLALGVWYVIGLLRKPRFARGSGILIDAQRVLRRGGLPEWVGRPRWHRLRTNWFSRHLVPYVPERIACEDVTFEARRRKHTVRLPAEPLDDLVRSARTVEVNGFPAASPVLRGATLPTNASLRVETAGRTVYYVYLLEEPLDLRATMERLAR